MTIYKAHRLSTTVDDSQGQPRTLEETFFGGAFTGYDIVLGWDWHAAADPMISYSAGTFIWNPSDANKLPQDKLSALLAAIEDREVAFQIAPDQWVCSITDGSDPADLPEHVIGRTDDETALAIAMVAVGSQKGHDEDPTTFNPDAEHEWHIAAVTLHHRFKTACDSHPNRIGITDQAVSDIITSVRPTMIEPKTRRRVAAVRMEGELPEEYADFSDVFSEDFTIMANSEYDHAIDLEPGKMPPHMGMYNLSQSELKTLREYIDNALKKGWIRSSKSPCGAPILFVPKADGSVRLCVDYRGLNRITVKNRYPLPLISELLDRLGSCTTFTKLDLRDAYHRIRIKQGDEWKTAFKTRYGLFEYMVMPFGLANAPSTFQAYIHKALGGLVDTICVVYLDDILIYSKNESDHRSHVRAVLEKLREWKLYAKPSKCFFNRKRIEFLGFIVTPEGIVMDRERVRSIEEWPEPKSFKDVQIFLGFANFYRRFIWGYSGIARPLNDLLKAGQKQPGGKKQTVRKKGQPQFHQPWTWPESAAHAFRVLREAFAQAPILAHFDPALPIMVVTDASDAAYAGILLQPDPRGHWHPVAYHSKSFQNAAIRYHTHDKELMAIAECFKTWRHYLEGASHPIRVLSDHNNLRYFMSTTALTGRQARIAEDLAVFDFEIEYKKGIANPADGLSRRPDYFNGFKDDKKRENFAGLLPTLQRKLAAAASTVDEAGAHAIGCEMGAKSLLTHRYTML
jgi:hypothetical protein